MDDDQRTYSENPSPWSRLDREVLRSYAGGGEATPLDAGHASRSKGYAKEVADVAKARRRMLIKGYFTLIVIIVMGGIIIWQVYLWSSQVLEGDNLLDRARTGTEKMNPLNRNTEQ